MKESSNSTPEVELEELDNIASSRRLKNSSLCDKDIQTCAVNAIDNIQNSHSGTFAYRLS